ncbi:hypothetical protein NHX12_029526 [Muraenolepis orangiensis]|uniref:Putative nuclease HARBI1 n=1 Tax=Muraenolepis orangiensis TaxID=630683 RepID=A0A9Q0DA78_9TELE|nr:hypothetical protein NHX12_029526 [Muraenolepis orangiensis]
MAIPIAILDCDLLLHGRGHKTMDRFDLDSVSDHYLLTTRTQRSRAISPEVQILAALGFYTSGSFQTSMGDAIGISQASMSRCVTNVTRALVEKAPHFISFSRDSCSRDQSVQDFQRVAEIPGVRGVLDCVQVAIKAPNSEDSSYINKKGFHSIGCQLVCDARGLLLSAETCWPGGLKDTEILERSSISKIMQSSEDGWLLGGRPYPLKRWLLTPIFYPASPAELRYNLAHAATCEIVDRTFRAIQTRFRCLDGSKGYLQYSPEKSSSILLACCVLHNASLQSGLDAWTLERTEAPEQPETYEQCPGDEDTESENIRKELILKHFS